ncbi:plexin-B3 isoform X3 [Syngnathoides biaculeatus]|uniref:plexin-B3 isoform X3 n=1 Tax=Syngnathoides biaculeatus TaxID=300417 RepID=UPI002ADD5AC2|nr:plexin-B3 isoform X3 [Syngnathoides biaculeatus]
MLVSVTPLLSLLLLLLLFPPTPLLAQDSSVQWVTLRGAPLSHLLLDMEARLLYVGGVDHLHQLSLDLELISHVKTGPHLDSPNCLPPIALKDCPSARPTHNYNKLLLLEQAQGKEAGSVISCGSLYQGTCEKRSLSNISQLLYQSTNPVDTQFVAANDPHVSTVGIVLTAGSGVSGEILRFMLVGRGFTGMGLGDIPPITARRLYPTVYPQRAFTQEDELGKLIIGSYSEYDIHFVKVVAFNNHVYFLFSRRDVRSKMEYRTYASRLCVSDRNFYSYVEVPLLCHGGYNLVRGAWLGLHSGKSTMFLVMVAGWTSTSVATDNSALCIFGMMELDAMMERVRESCYTKGGRSVKGQEEAYVVYTLSSNCLTLPQVSVSEYPCGWEHTPSPIGSVEPLLAMPTFTATTQLTAVATATEAGHTVAFVGNREGRLHKVLVRSNGSGEVYGNVLVDSGSAVNADLLLDTKQQKLFILTNSRVSKVAMSSCEWNIDCQSCLATRDLYCGWCVLEGKCCRKHECQRHLHANHWIWSFDSSNKCLSVQSVQPANQSKDQQTEVTLSLSQLPVLTVADSLSCVFHHIPPQPAFINGTSITCQSPKPALLPLLPTESDHIILPLSLTFGDVTISTATITFYDCGAVSRLNQTSQCLACVVSVWKCSWCPLDQQCTHRKRCPNEHTTLSQKDSTGPTQCPQVFGLHSSSLIPVGLTSTVVLMAHNMDIFKDEAPYVCVVEIEGVEVNLAAIAHKAPDHTYSFTCSPHQFQYAMSRLVYSALVFLKRGSRRIDALPGLQLHLYNCSAGQSDCSQCRAVPKEYGCVWCTESTASSCVYNQSCADVPADSCPPPQITQVWPLSSPLEGGVLVTITGSNLGMSFQDVVSGVTVAGVQCPPQPEEYKISTRMEPVSENLLVCQTLSTNQTGKVPIRMLFSKAERTVPNVMFHYVDDPVITEAMPTESYYAGGRAIVMSGRNLDVVQHPVMSVWVEPVAVQSVKRRRRLALLTAKQLVVFNGTIATVSEHCTVLSSFQMTCPTPSLPPDVKVKDVWFQMDNVRVHYKSIKFSGSGFFMPMLESVDFDHGKSFKYYPNPRLFPLNREDPDAPYRFKAGGVIAVEGEDLTQAMSRQEVTARLGDQECEVKTLDSTHLYCEPPEVQPMSVDASSMLPRFQVQMGNLQVDLGMVQYDTDSLLPPIPLAAQIGLGAGVAFIILSVLIIILMYRRKSKQALRDYKKVLLQLETLEINVGDQCRKEFTDLMTEMMDLSSDVGGPGLPLLDYRTYAERVFFPGQQAGPLSRHLDLPESSRHTVEHGLQQLNNLLNNRLFLVRFIHTLEEQQGFSQRDRGYMASLLTMVLHDKLEYFTEVMKCLLQDLVQQYVAKNPKLMLRRTETVVEKMLTNWMSICLYSFLKDVVGEPLYMLYRAIKYQVDKGPVDAMTGKAKRTLNDSHLLREDIDYCTVTLNVLLKNEAEVQPCPVKVLDTDTITQVKDKILDQVFRGVPFSQRPAAGSLDLEWRSGQAGHLTLSDDDVTAVVQGHWKQLNTLQHYKLPDGATVALVPRSQSSSGTRFNQVFQTGERTPMLEGEEEEGLRLWHLVKSSEDPEIPKHRKSSMRECERAKAIPEIYLTRLLSMKGTLQKFVDDVFVAILSTKRPPPIAIRFFFDFLDDMAEKYDIEDPETVHIWKTNSLPLRFWVNILKNPQFVLDVQVTDSIDAILSVIAQTFIDSCTTSEHKVGRNSPVNKLLYAREIPRYKQLVERYYSDIHSAASGCYQEMNSTLTELSGRFASEMNSHVALHELYKYINKYYDQVILSLEEDNCGQKMQLAYRLQQVAALVENKVTDL